MIRLLLIVGCLANSLSVLAEKPAGFLWYNLKEDAKKTQAQKPLGILFNRLSFTARDAVLRFYTMEALHKARHTKRLEDMKVFLSLQNYWLKESTHFSHLFQKTMLSYPQYDYTVTHPTSNLGVKLLDERRELRRKKTIANLAHSHGLLFFYRGENPYDQKQIPIVRDFCARFHLSLIPVSVDGLISADLPRSRVNLGHAEALGVRYFPALMLVNPKTRVTAPVAFGFTTQDVIEERLEFVATAFKGEGV